MSESGAAVEGRSTVEAEPEAVRRRPGKVLMVSYNYPPVGAIGSVRTTKLAKYLPARGWNPTILTVRADATKWGGGDAAEGENPGVRVVRAPFTDVLTSVQGVLAKIGLVKPGRAGEESLLRMPGRGSGGGVGRLAHGLFRWVKRWLAFPDRYLLWIPSAVAYGLRELSGGGYDVIYSTSPPVTDHLAAAVLSGFSGLPWVADYRDPWSGNDLRGYTRFQRSMHARLERAVMRRAAAVVAATGPWARALEDLLERPGGVICITSGYDPDDFRTVAPSPVEGFVVTYTGTVHWLEKDGGLAALAAALEEVLSGAQAEEFRVRLCYYGPHGRAFSEVAGALSAGDALEIHGPVPRSESLLRQRESTILLLLMRNSPYAATLHTGKVFEYLGARRPILAWAPAGGAVVELLEETGAGVAVATREGLADVLRRWNDEFRRTGGVAYRGSEEALSRYAWPNLARKMASVMDSLVGQRQRGGDARC